MSIEKIHLDRIESHLSGRDENIIISDIKVTENPLKIKVIDYHKFENMNDSEKHEFESYRARPKYNLSLCSALIDSPDSKLYAQVDFDDLPQIMTEDYVHGMYVQLRLSHGLYDDKIEAAGGKRQ